MTPLRFTAPIKIHNGNPYVLITKARATALQPGWRKPLPVLVRINGQPKTAWRINLMPMGDGRFYLYLHGIVRKASKTQVGDRVDVEVAFDAAYRTGPMHPMPAWFRAPLNKIPKAKKAWDALIPSRKKEILRYFSRLKSLAARERNLERALRVLAGKRERFMARTWSEGR